MSGILRGKCVIVTGGTKGLGQAITLALASQGARVVVFSRSASAVDRTLERAAAIGGDVHGLTADIARMSDVQRVFQEADRRLGGLDILINNAALPANSILNTDWEEWSPVMDVNLLGAMRCTKEAITRLRKRGGGHIVFISSLCTDVLDAGADLYVASKTGLDGFADSIRKQVADENIKVSIVHPGAMATEMVTETEEEKKQLVAAGEMLHTQPVAEAVIFCLTQPQQVDITSMTIRPHRQSRL